jgi:hypothetical protein
MVNRIFKNIKNRKFTLNNYDDGEAIAIYLFSNRIMIAVC